MTARLTAAQFRKAHVKPGAAAVDPEKALSGQCIKWLKQRGYSEPKGIPAPDAGVDRGVYFTTQQQRKSRVTEGLPDLLVKVPGTDELRGVELKASETATVSREQEIARRCRCSVIVWTLEQFTAWVTLWEETAMAEAGEAEAERIMGAGPKHRTTRLVTQDTPALRRRARRAA